MSEVKKKVQEYYTASTEDYINYYQSGWHQHMHYGFDRDLPKGGNPTENLVKYMAEIAKMQPGERLLDAGCGLGGSAMWLAANKGVQSVGLNFMYMQLTLANGYAKERGRTEDTKFVCGDFTKAPFQNESFDVIWAVESSDHAPDKKEWIAEMYRMLKPGGRLIVGDGFKREEPFNEKDRKEYECFLAGWAVPHLASPKEFTDGYLEAGFQQPYDEDITADVMPHAKAIFRFAFIAIPMRWTLLKLGLTSKEKYGNAQATYYQYTTLKKAFWTYRIFCGVKPK